MVTLWVTLIGSILLTLYNLQFKSTFSITSLSALDLLCVIALFLNYRGHYTTAALILSSMVLVTLTFNLYDGDGLFDAGIAAYPIFIILGTLLLGKRSVLGFSLSSIVSLAIIGFLQSRGMVDVTVKATDASNLIPIFIFISAAGLIIWVIMSNIENNLLKIQESEKELREAYEMTLYGWAKALEYRDKETEGHSLRVVELSQKLAKALGCSEQEITNIRRGAILHDIGKMGVPDHILLKPAPLEKDEMEIMRQHPTYGKEMLEEISFLKPALTIVYGHHEHWDGSGYPQGLKGEEIPLSARIFAIIDTWDALSFDRPYRSAWPPERVVEHIQKNAGILFDPHIVNVFMKIIGR